MLRKRPGLWGFITGCIMVCLIWGWAYRPRDMFEPKPPVNMSSHELIEKIRQYSRFTIPDNAYDIQYFNYGFTDGFYWCAFSVDEEDMKKLEAEYAPLFAANPGASKTLAADDTIPQPSDKNLSWWPKEKGNLRVSEAHRGWIGIDSANRRVYCYYTMGNG